MRGGTLHLAGVAAQHDHDFQAARARLLEAELAAERDRAAQLERERDAARLEVARLCMEKLLNSEGYVDCDRPVLQLIRGDDG